MKNPNDTLLRDTQLKTKNANVTQSHSHAVTLDWMKMKNQKDTPTRRHA